VPQLAHFNPLSAYVDCDVEDSLLATRRFGHIAVTVGDSVQDNIPNSANIIFKHILKYIYSTRHSPRSASLQIAIHVAL